MAQQRLFSPVNAFIQGRAARQDYDYGQTRNALAQMELEAAPQQMAQRNRLGEIGIEGAQQDLDANKARTAYATLKQALDSGNAKAFMARDQAFLSNFQRQHGVDFSSLSDEQATAELDHLARVMAAKAGMAPAAPEVFTLKPGEQRFQGGKVVASVPASQDNGFTLSAGETRFGPDGKPLASVAPKPVTGNKFRALTPQEVQAAGLPAGTSAQIDEATGKIDVLSKRDTTATLSQKDANTAKLKLNTVKIARNQLQKIKAAFETGRGGAGPNAFGGAQGWMPTQQGKTFDAAVDQMRSTLTALTRVPGVGAMSDYETKLDQAKFPSRTDYESVTAEKIQGIEDMLSAIETGYSDLLSGGSAPQPDQQAPSPSAEITATGPNGQKIVLRNGQWVPL
jgi:hypothetical protein